MASPNIITVSASVVSAPAPSTLQSTGAAISQGATTLSSGSDALLTELSDLTAILSAPLASSSLQWSGGTVLVTTAAAIPGLTTGDTFVTSIAGVTPAGYNGTFLATVTGSNTFTYPLASNPTSETVPGTYTPPNQGELISMVTTFYAQGSSQSVYVLELGAGDATSGPAALGTWITANPGFFYSYLVPRSWDGSAGLLALIAQYETPTSKTYFFTTTTLGTYSSYTGVMKNVLAEVEAPGIPLTEFSLAADFQHTLSYAPSPTNKMTPNSFAPLFGVTPYPAKGNNSLFTTLLNANINYVGTGAQGGVSGTILYEGTTADGKDFMWWYAADWTQINIALDLANAIITQSQNKINPLVYNQAGINTLQDTAVQTLQTGVSYGLLNGSVTQTALDQATFTQNLDNGVYAGQNVINAIPFSIYTAANPSDYGEGLYAGFTAVAIPQTGFKQIVFALLLTDLLSL